MTRPFLVLIVTFAFFIQACGLENATQQQVAMTEDEAMDTLMEVPLVAGGHNIRGRRSNVSAAELRELLEDLVESGELSVNNGRGAVGDGSGADLGILGTIFDLIQSGQARTIWGLAKGLLNSSEGDGSTTSKLDGILGLLQAALPIITAIAPQFAPIVSALMVIIPMVVTFINLFRRGAAMNRLFLMPTFA